MTTKFKIAGMPKDKDYNRMPFGRQIEHRRAFEDFKATAKSVWISQKRKSHDAAWREFVKLYKPSQYFAQYNDEPMYRDDTFEVFYTE